MTLPTTPVPASLPMPADMTVDDILGGAPKAAATAEAAANAVKFGQAPEGTAPAAANPTADANMAAVATALGVTVPPGVDVGTTLQPMLDMIAKSGAAQEQNQARYANTPQVVQGLDLQTQQGAPAPAPAPSINFDSLDFGDTDPKIQQAFKALAGQSQEAIAALAKQAEVARLEAVNATAKFAESERNAQVNEQNRVAQQAINYLDGLASPEFGVGSNRTMAQTLASEQVMRQAGLLIRGLNQYGQTLPIEQVVSAAIVSTGRQIPAAQAAPAPVSGLAPVPAAAGLAAAPAPMQNVGSSGPPGSMMNDAEYMAGARAILSR